METTIDSLESKLASANEEKEFAVSSNENLTSELQALSDELNLSRLELDKLQEENSHLSLDLEESKSYNHKMEDSIKLILERKDELEMQLTEALLAMDEEKAIWAAKEKASIEAIDAKSRKYSSEITLLLKEIKEVGDQLTSYKEDCEVLRKKLLSSEEISQREEELSKEKYVEYEKLISDLRVSQDQSKRSQEDLVSKLQKLSSDHRLACEHTEKLQMELNMLNKEKELLLNETREFSQTLESQILMVTNERDALQSQIKEHRVDLLTMKSSNLSEELLKANAEIEGLTCRLSKLEVKMHDDEVIHSKERAKLRMMLRGTNMKMEAFSVRYKEAVQENNLMDTKFREASTKLKSQLAQYAQENFNLRKQLVSVKSH